MILIIFKIIIIFLSLIIPLLISIAFYTLAERKLLSSFQRRVGPNVVGFFGIFQPFADGLKLLTKEIIFPKNSNKVLFLLSPCFMLILSFISWSFIPFSDCISFIDFNLSLLYLFALTSLSVYGIILGAWSSNSRYAFLGALRSSAQMISYEISFGLILIIIILSANSFNLLDIINIQKITNIDNNFLNFKQIFYFNNYHENWFIFPLLPLFYIFFISILAETNRAPFDLPEAEAELVAGYNVEYSGILFAFYFLAEYSSMLLMSVLICCLFFGGNDSFFLFFNLIEININLLYLIVNETYYDIPNFIKNFNYNFSYIIKILFFSFSFIWVRATLPRYRYNQLMELGWKIFLPIILSFFIFFVGILYFYKFFFFFNYSINDLYLYKLINIDVTSYNFLKNINFDYILYDKLISGFSNKYMDCTWMYCLRIIIEFNTIRSI